MVMWKQKFVWCSHSLNNNTSTPEEMKCDAAWTSLGGQLSACRLWPGFSVHPAPNTYISPAIFVLSVWDQMAGVQSGLKGGIFVCVVHGLHLSFCFPLLVI